MVGWGIIRSSNDAEERRKVVQTKLFKNEWNRIELLSFAYERLGKGGLHKYSLDV